MDHAVLRRVLDFWSIERSDLRVFQAILRRRPKRASSHCHCSNQCPQLDADAIPYLPCEYLQVSFKVNVCYKSISNRER